MLELNTSIAYFLIVLACITSVLVAIEGLKLQHNLNLQNASRKVRYSTVPVKALQEILFLFHFSITISLVTTRPVLNITLFPTTVITGISVFLPYLVKPSQFIFDIDNKYEVDKKQITRGFDDMLVYTSGIYAASGLYAFYTNQYFFGFMLCITSLGSTIYHLHHESSFFNFDNVFAMSKLFVYLFSAYDALTIYPLFAYLGIAGGPIALYLIAGCGTPVEIIMEDTAHLVHLKTAAEEEFLPHMIPNTINGPISIAADGLLLRSKSPKMSRRRTSVNEHGADKLVSTLKSMSSSNRTSGTDSKADPLLPDDVMHPETMFGFAKIKENALMLCCVPKIAIFRKHRQMYDTLHMLWHFVSALGPIASTWLAYSHYYSDEADPEHINDGVLGYGYFDPSTKCFPIVPFVSIGCSVFVNVMGNWYGIMPMD